MDEKGIKAIIRDIHASPTECEWVEIKHNNEDPELIGESVSALANGAAYMGQSRGFMAWGLDDSTHQVIGTKFNPKTAKYGNEELENWISRGLSPRIDFSFQEITLPEGRVVVMMIDSAGNTPVKFKGTAFIRVGTYKKKLASLMRRMNICEERGSGIDRALLQCEIYQLPAPDFQSEELFTKVIMFAPMTLRQMNKEDKRRACYQHCCLEYLSGKKMTNESFRGRLNISDENYSIASRIISDTIAAKYIKLDDATASSKKYARYVPFWV